ncbi:hypothetical protein DV735_g5309, partial [Chaetothyriales sp. CBS 134920]
MKPRKCQPSACTSRRRVTASAVWAVVAVATITPSWALSTSPALATTDIDINTPPDWAPVPMAIAPQANVHNFQLRHVFHHGTYRDPQLHLRYDRLADRSPAAIEEHLAVARLTGQPAVLAADEWTLDAVTAPDISDRDTIINMAIIASNAYAIKPDEGDWREVGQGFNHSRSFGWDGDGLRGHVFVDEANTTIVVSLKGTSPAVFDGEGTTTRDKINDNLFFSCCCAQGGQYFWRQVCDCAAEGTYTCDERCVERALRAENRYYRASIDLYTNITELYPDANVWVVGHSLGGSVSSLLGMTFGLPVIAYEAPGDDLAAKRLGLPRPPTDDTGRAYRGHYTGSVHIGHTADPVFMGTCNGATATCTLGGYAMESQCHSGLQCVYDTVGDWGWRVGIGYHKIHNVIDSVLRRYPTVPQCVPDDECVDCFNWKFFRGNDSYTTTSSTTATSSSTSSFTHTRTSTCETPGWFGCLDESTTSTATLPDEVLSLVCQELGRGDNNSHHHNNSRDFATLFRCALSARALADPALRTLYQYHEQSPSFLQSDEVDVAVMKAAEAAETYRRWTVLWRSIILSCLDGGLTYKPYCRYLRMLDFRNLSAMLEDFKFTGATLSAFFQGPLMKQFHFPRQEFKRRTVDTVATINAVGDAVTLRTAQIEEIAGHLSPGFLPRWIARVRQLQALVLWKGDALANGAGSAIAVHCEHFRSLTVREWLGQDADATFATFLAELRPDTLAYFEMISYNNIGRASLTALGRQHARSLQVLVLGNMSKEAVLSLDQLQHCTELHTLVLEDNLGSVQLEEDEEAVANSVFDSVVSWLSSCSKLRDLTIKRFHDGPALLSQILPSPQLRLTKLSLEGYAIGGNSSQTSQLFHSSLSEQKTLESIWLKGSGDDTVPDDLQILVDGLCNLPRLRELVLKDVSDEFEAEHMIALALRLPLLEEFWTSGGEVSGDLLTALAQLRHLKSVTLYAQTQFSCDEIIDFLDQLDPVAQRGFTFSLMAADPDDGNLSEQEQELIRDFIAATLNGRFDRAFPILNPANR